MRKKIAAAAAKAKLAGLIDSVAYRGDQIIIERRGKPMAALVSIADLELIQERQPLSPDPKGALALLGLWKDVPEKEIDDMIKKIYEDRHPPAARRAVRRKS